MPEKINIKSQVTWESEMMAQLAYQRYQFSHGQSSSQSAPTSLQVEFLDLISECFKKSNYFPVKALQQYPIPVIVDYLEKTHQLYLKKRLPEIGLSIHNLAGNLEQTHPSILLLKVFFKKYKAHLSEHIQEEEEMLLPYVKFLHNSARFKIPMELSFSKLGKYCLLDFMHEHHDMDLGDIQKVIRSYEPKDVLKSPYRVLLTQLKTFELDLTIHSRIEEEVLIPLAIDLESEIKIK